MLPIIAQDGLELFIYDIAVHPVHQRKGIGRPLIQAALDALDFYRTIGGSAQAVRSFLFDTNAAVGPVTS